MRFESTASSFFAFFLAVCGILIVTGGGVQAQSSGQMADALPTHLDDPIFINPPSLSSKTEGNKDLGIYFQYNYDKCRAYYGENYYKGCSRRLGLSGRRAEAGITIMPPIDGEWRWDDDYQLSFTPSGYWQAGTRYTVSLDLDQMDVPQDVVLNQGKDWNGRTATLTLTTEPLTVGFSNMDYMQDPNDPARRLVSLGLNYNYPVDPELLKKKVRLEMEEESGERLVKTDIAQEFNITDSSDHLLAQAEIPVKDLPDRDRYIRMAVGQGLAAIHGGQNSSSDFSERTRIPTPDSYLALDDASVAIIRDDKGAPGQIVSLGTNVKAKPADILGKAALYLLPAQHPVMKRNNKNGKDSAFYKWSASNEVTPEVLKLSEPVQLKPMTDQNGYATQFGFPVEVPEGRYLYLTVDKGAAAFGGYRLGRDFSAILEVPKWPHDIEIMQSGSILTLSGKRTLSLHARGTDLLKLDIAHIRNEALQHFISQTSGDISSPSFENWRFNQSDIAQIDTREVPMDFKSEARSQYAALDFSPYLKDGQKGLFLLDIHGFRDNKLVGESAQRFVLVTDMGLLVKKARDLTRDVYLVSFTNGKPVEGAVISVLGRNGLSVINGKTDANGHIRLPDLGHASPDRTPVAITAQKGNDFSFIPYDRSERDLNMSQFDTGGNVTINEGLNGFLFSDRGIYRPGETVRLAAIVKNADWSLLPEGLPLKLIVTDPRGRTVDESLLPFPSDGLQDHSLTTGSDWPSGIYQAHLKISRGDNDGDSLGSVTFRVEDFEPDRLKIKTVFSSLPRGWARPGGLGADVTLQNLYGTPASDRRIASSVTLNPVRLYFPDYKDYTFYDSYPAKPRTVQYDLPDAKTDGKGQARLELGLERQDEASWSLNLETSGFEAGSGRGVTSYATLMVSPMDYAIGYKSLQNLSYLTKNKVYSVSLLALGPDLASVETGPLTLSLMRKGFVSTLVKRNDGSYAYESTPKEDEVKSQSFEIAAKDTYLELPTSEVGSFSWRIKNKEGRVVADIPFTVAGEGEKSAGLNRETVLELHINKDRYEAGDMIELDITAPYSGSGLITLETDHVIAQKWFKTDKTDTIERIQIPEGFAGKGYVSVSFVRDINSQEIYLKPLSYAVVPFIAGTDSRNVRIELSAPAMIKPGEPVKIGYHGNRKGKAIIYAVNEGILQVAKYKTPDPVRFFLLDRALQVSTSQMLDLLMPEYDLVRQLSATGGGAMAETAALGKHLNPFKRKTLAPALYWSGIVDLDTDERSVTFTAPDHFNGEMRIMAVAVADDAVGSAEQPVTVQGDLVLTPNLPLFMAPADQAQISVTVANNIKGSGKDAAIQLAFANNKAFTLGNIPQNVKVPEGEERSVSLDLTAHDTLGATNFQVTAHYKDIEQTVKAPFGIRPPVALETSLYAGYAENGKGSIAPVRTLYKEFSQKQATLSPLPTAYIYGLMRYLDGFPYGCSEQIVSQAYPQISLYNRPEFGISQDKMQEKLSSVISTLRQRQTDEGGFSLWGGGYNTDEFVSIYALDFLIKAQEKNIPVPVDMTENGLRYLRNWANEDVKSMGDARNKAYGVYILTRSGIVTSNEILHLLKYFEDEKKTGWKTDLSAVYIAASYKMMQQSDLADKVMDAFEDSASAESMTYKQEDWQNEWYNPFTRYAQYVSLLARHFPERMANIDRNIVFRLAAFTREQRYNTLSAAYAIEALNDYAATMKSLQSQNIAVNIDGKESETGTGNPVIDIQVDAKDIAFSGPDQPVFYTLSETGYDRAISREPVAQNMDIERHYLKEDGSALNGPAELGDVIEAVVTVRSHDRRFLKNVAIVDLLPAGFAPEPRDGHLPSGIDAIDQREDRIIAFGRVTPYGQTFRYRLRAVTKGQWIVPPPFAEAMYDPTTKARGVSGEITVINPQ